MGGLIGHSTGRRSLHGWGGTHVCPPNRGERSTRMVSKQLLSLMMMLLLCFQHRVQSDQL